MPFNTPLLRTRARRSSLASPVLLCFVRSSRMLHATLRHTATATRRAAQRPGMVSMGQGVMRGDSICVQYASHGTPQSTSTAVGVLNNVTSTSLFLVFGLINLLSKIGPRPQKYRCSQAAPAIAAQTPSRRCERSQIEQRQATLYNTNKTAHHCISVCRSSTSFLILSHASSNPLDA